MTARPIATRREQLPGEARGSAGPRPGPAAAVRRAGRCPASPTSANAAYQPRSSGPPGVNCPRKLLATYTLSVTDSTSSPRLSGIQTIRRMSGSTTQRDSTIEETSHVGERVGQRVDAGEGQGRRVQDRVEHPAPHWSAAGSPAMTRLSRPARQRDQTVAGDPREPQHADRDGQGVADVAQVRQGRDRRDPAQGHLVAREQRRARRPRSGSPPRSTTSRCAGPGPPVGPPAGPGREQRGDHEDEVADEHLGARRAHVADSQKQEQQPRARVAAAVRVNPRDDDSVPLLGHASPLDRPSPDGGIGVSIAQPVRVCPGYRPSPGATRAGEVRRRVLDASPK